MYDFLVVGAGLFGAVFAQKARECGKSVLIIDKKNHIAGSIYTEKREGINIHMYGAHIFHTNNESTWNYIRKYASFSRFTNSPLANYHGELYSLPVNMYTFNKMWGVNTPEEALAVLTKQRGVFSGEPDNLESRAIHRFGKDIYERLIKGYTEKQWGKSCGELPPQIIDRLPLRLTYDNNYFNSLYQGIPLGGYTEMVRNILRGTEVRLGIDYLEHRIELDSLAKHIVFSGPIDSFFDYSLGHLDYRSLRFESEVLNISNYQGNAVVNYTDRETPWVRIIEHKWFDSNAEINDAFLPKTVITREYAIPQDRSNEPYYPVNDAKNNRLYSRYKSMAEKYPNIIFGGRLGEYKYYDMDQTIESAIQTFIRTREKDSKA